MNSSRQSPHRPRVIRCWFVLSGLLLLPSLFADVTLAPLFRDGAVVQRDTAIPVWGRARSGENVNVTLGLATAATVADAEGRWLVRLPAQPANSIPADLIVEGSNRLVVRDVLVGDVWLCGGQSNMQMAVANTRDAAPAIASARHPHLRLFKVAPQFSQTAAETVDGEWQATTPETVGRFSATAYFFGRDLHTALGVPIGLIVSSYGNTAIATWRGPAALAGDAIVEAWWQRQQRASAPPRPHRQPSAGHHGMIAPLAPYALRGFLWYQGEADATETRDLAPHYAAQFTGLIREWRALFGGGQPLPFYWVQLAGFGGAGARDWTGVREQQTRALAEPATGQAMAIDLGDETDIHPRDKQSVGARLARLALRRAYGRSVVDTGPTLVHAEVAAGRVVLRFDSASLRVEGKLADVFELAGSDGVFHFVDHAIVEGDSITLDARAVATPVAVRHAWQARPSAFLFNADGLPAALFRHALSTAR